MMERSLFLASLAALLAAPSLPHHEVLGLDTLGSVDKIPITLDEQFRAGFGYAKGAEHIIFNVRGPLDRGAHWISPSYIMNIGGKYYSNATDIDMLDEMFNFRLPEVLADMVRQSAINLGQLARRSFNLVGGEIEAMDKSKFDTYPAHALPLALIAIA